MYLAALPPIVNFPGAPAAPPPAPVSSEFSTGAPLEDQSIADAPIYATYPDTYSYTGSYGSVTTVPNEGVFGPFGLGQFTPQQLAIAGGIGMVLLIALAAR